METETKETETEKRPDRRILSRPEITPLAIAILVLAVLLAGGGAWYLLANRAKQPAPVTIPPPAPPAVSVPKGDLQPEKNPCQEIDEQIAQFFGALDNRDIVAARRFQGGSQAHFARLINTLLAHPPVVMDESKHLSNILNNTTHFFRILGEDDLSLIRELLNREEGNNVELAMSLFYRWSEQMPQCGEATTQIRLPLPGLYEYACFFLNTMGGQAYVFRRDPRLRLLVRYYSILILDRANDASLNRHGLDIRPATSALLKELRAVTGLAGQEDYTARLLAIQEKYPMADQIAPPATGK